MHEGVCCKSGRACPIASKKSGVAIRVVTLFDYLQGQQCRNMPYRLANYHGWLPTGQLAPTANLTRSLENQHGALRRVRDRHPWPQTFLRQFVTEVVRRGSRANGERGCSKLSDSRTGASTHACAIPRLSFLTFMAPLARLTRRARISPGRRAARARHRPSPTTSSNQCLHTVPEDFIGGGSTGRRRLRTRHRRRTDGLPSCGPGEVHVGR